MTTCLRKLPWFGVAAFACSWFLGWAGSPDAEPVPPVKDVIVLIADGCGAEHYTLARWHRGRPLALDEIMVGGLQTYIADSVVADSAPASTAFATGCRTSDKFIGLGPKPGTLPCVPEPEPQSQCTPPSRPVTPHEPAEYQIEIPAFGHVFRPGHKLCADPHAAAGGRSDWGHQVGAPSDRYDSHPPPGIVTVLHDTAHPSSLLLPVLPELPPLRDPPVPVDQQAGIQPASDPGAVR